MKLIAGRFAIMSAALVASACARESAPERTVLFEEDATYDAPVFSPDGARLRFTRSVKNKASVWVAGPDGSNAKRLGAEAPYVANARWSPDGRLIGYTSDIDGPPDVYIVPADGGDIRRVTKAIGLEYMMSFRKGTDEILLMDNGSGENDLYSLNLANDSVARITSFPGDENGQWSPDGTRIAFTRTVGGKSTLWVMEAGKPAVQLTTEGYETYEDWSLDGSLIAYSSNRTGRSDIWVMPVAGGAPKQITTDVRDDYAPEFSPDGKWIAYVSQRGGQQDIWLASLEGGDHIRVTDDAGREGRPTWSADGTALAFTYDANRTHLWVVPAEGGEPRQLTTGPENDHTPRISPDGKRVLFASHRAGNSDLFVVPIEGGEPVALTTESTDEDSPHWSPDGSKVLFSSLRGGTTSLFVMPATGGAATKLLDWTEDQLAGEWSYDGKSVIFASPRESQNTDLWIVGADGSNPRRLTTNARALGAFQSRDGQTLAVVQGNALGEINLVTMPTEGGAQTKLPIEGYMTPVEWSAKGELLMVGFARGSPTRFDSYIYRGGNVEPILADSTDDFCGAWSPDGTMLACVTLKPGHGEISVVPSAGGPQRVLTNSFAEKNLPVWTPDGKSIVYQAYDPRNKIVKVKVSGLLERGSAR